jgi:hypothetical protein
MSTPILNIEARKSGLCITANPITVAEANEASLLTARLAFPLRLVHETLVQGTTDPILEPQVQIFVPRAEDRECEVIEFEQLPLKVAEPVRPIDPANIPAWLIAALRKAQPRHYAWKTADQLDGGESEAAWLVLTNSYSAFLDHAGFITDKRGDVFISEPYALNADQLGTLFEFTSDGDLDFMFSGVSNYHPSATLRISIWKRDGQ